MSKKPKKEKFCNRPALLYCFIPGEGRKAICGYHANRIEERDGIHIPMLLLDKPLRCELLRG